MYTIASPLPKTLKFRDRVIFIEFFIAGTIVYLDVEKQDILDRLNVMKVNRIVGQEKGKLCLLTCCCYLLLKCNPRLCILYRLFEFCG